MPSSDQGQTQNRYQVVLRTLVFLTRGRYVLLIRGAPNKRIWPNLFNGLGGHVERGEDVLTSARRELFEETGYQIPDLWLCGIINIETKAEAGICLFVMRGDIHKEYPEEEINSKFTDEGELIWVPIDKVAELAVVEDIPQILPRILSVNRGDMPFFAHYHYDENDMLQVRFAGDP